MMRAARVARVGGTVGRAVAGGLRQAGSSPAGDRVGSAPRRLLDFAHRSVVFVLASFSLVGTVVVVMLGKDLVKIQSAKNEQRALDARRMLGAKEQAILSTDAVVTTTDGSTSAVAPAADKE